MNTIRRKVPIVVDHLTQRQMMRLMRLVVILFLSLTGTFARTKPLASVGSYQSLEPQAVADSQVPKKEIVALNVTTRNELPPDLAVLKQRLKDTQAIGPLTKIVLKHQADDLLDEIRAFHQGRLDTTLADLRPPYDRLVLKVVSLLQDGDPTLAAAIVASREALWGVLSDPAKFATI